MPPLIFTSKLEKATTETQINLRETHNNYNAQTLKILNNSSFVLNNIVFFNYILHLSVLTRMLYICNIK